MTSISGLSGVAAHANAYKAGRANETTGTQNSGRKTADDVLAYLREKMPGWNISTTTADWGEGFRNIQIDRDILEKMANDPREMERVTSMIKEFESAVPELEKWQEQNPDQSLILRLMLDNKGNTTANATIRSLLGTESSVSLNMSESSWMNNLLETLRNLPQGKTDEADQSRSWTA